MSEDQDRAVLLDQLRRKQGTWVNWGKMCQQLQKVMSTQDIFEETGFQTIHQNQIIVAAQVYGNLEQAAAPTPVLEYFATKGSDSLYELRVLPFDDRVRVAELLWSKNLDSEGAHEVTKAVKEFAYLKAAPAAFTDHPGDATAYQYWHTARQKTDLQERSRLIAKGLFFAHSLSARQAVEKLLTDFTVIKTQRAPSWPLYRPDQDEALPRILPVTGSWPITKAQLGQAPFCEEIAPFSLIQGQGLWVAVAGYPVIRHALAPVAIPVTGQDLGFPDLTEQLLVVVDREERTWNPESYFIAEVTEPSPALQIRYFAEDPGGVILGKVLVVLRPPRIFDEEYTKEPWQLDE